MNNQVLLGALRGLGYVLAFALLDYLIKLVGGGTIFSGSTATIITMILASIEHYVASLPGAPTDVNGTNTQGQ